VPFSEQRIGGVCAAALTPVDERGQPDHAALVAHCRRLLASGCDAINLLGTTGEATSLAVDARLAAMQAVAGSDLPVDRFMVGTGAAALADARVLTRAAVELGFGGALVIPPFYYKDIGDDGVFTYYDRLIAELGDPRLRLYLYHFPQLSGLGFSPSLVARLAEAFPQTIIGLKDSSGVAGYADSIVAACPALDVFPSSESTLADARARGYAGCISATANISAPLAARVWAGSRDSATALTAIRSAIVRHPIVPAVRAVTASLLADESWLRSIPPLVKLDSAVAARLVAELDMIADFASVRDVYACV
jgi:4-hydroxy-tetrahydrodipicolinate synthase